MSASPSNRALRLLDGTGPVGRIESNRLTFTGFGDPAEAAAAAWTARAALDRRHAKSRGEVAPYVERPPLFLVRTRADEWIEAGGKRLARLLRLKESGDHGQQSKEAEPSRKCYGLEIELPLDASELTIGSSAHVVYRALRQSGLPWSRRSERLAMESETTGTNPAC